MWIELWFAIPRVVQVCRFGAVDHPTAEGRCQVFRLKLLVVIERRNLVLKGGAVGSFQSISFYRVARPLA